MAIVLLLALEPTTCLIPATWLLFSGQEQPNALWKPWAWFSSFLPRSRSCVIPKIKQPTCGHCVYAELSALLVWKHCVQSLAGRDVGRKGSTAKKKGNERQRLSAKTVELWAVTSVAEVRCSCR